MKKTATAYDVRRYITLVQILAQTKVGQQRAIALRQLARAWGLSDGGSYEALVSRLAEHVVSYTREQMGTEGMSK